MNLYVDHVLDITWNKEAFERLVLPSQTKELVKALVMIRAKGHYDTRPDRVSAKRQDIIAGKGNGLIMLLHGGPGTGKTLTAGMSLLFKINCGVSSHYCAERFALNVRLLNFTVLLTHTNN